MASNGASAAPVARANSPSSTNSVRNVPSLVRRFGTSRNARPVGGFLLRFTVRNTCQVKWETGNTGIRDAPAG